MDFENEPTDIDQLVTVAAFSHAYEAYIAQGRLEAAGIRAFVADEHIVSVSWLQSQAVGGVKIRVARVDAEAAQTVLEEVPDGEETSSDSGWGTCKHCRSRNLELDTNATATMLTWLLLGIPLLLPQRRLKCGDCGNRQRI